MAAVCRAPYPSPLCCYHPPPQGWGCRLTAARQTATCIAIAARGNVVAVVQWGCATRVPDSCCMCGQTETHFITSYASKNPLVVQVLRAVLETRRLSKDGLRHQREEDERRGTNPPFLQHCSRFVTWFLTRCRLPTIKYGASTSRRRTRCCIPTRSFA